MHPGAPGTSPASSASRRRRAGGLRWRRTLASAPAPDVRPTMRLGVYLDYVHRRDGARVYAPRAFALFVAGLRPAFDELVVAGRVDPEPGTSHYPVPDDVEFAELPHYTS